MRYELFADHQRLSDQIGVDPYTAMHLLACGRIDEKVEAGEQHQKMVKDYADYARAIRRKLLREIGIDIVSRLTE